MLPCTVSKAIMFIFVGGFYHDCAVHDIDLVCWIVGEFQSSVFVQAHAHNKDIKEMGDVDTTLITLTFPSGVLASIDLSRNASYGYDQRCEVRVATNVQLSSVPTYFFCDHVTPEAIILLGYQK